MQAWIAGLYRGEQAVYGPISGTEGDMSRAKLVVAAMAAALGLALGGCSAMPDWVPDWMSPGPSTPPPQALHFESDPPGADVHTALGQSCLTPCTLSVPSQPQAVAIAKNGFIPQTVQVTLGPPPEHSFYERAAPALLPNPVRVMLQATLPPKPVKKRRSHKSVSRTRTAAAPEPGGASAPPPEPATASQSPFPTPPPMR